VAELNVKEMSLIVWALGRVGIVDKELLAVFGEILCWRLIMSEIMNEKGIQ